MHYTHFDSDHPHNKYLFLHLYADPCAARNQNNDHKAIKIGNRFQVTSGL